MEHGCYEADLVWEWLQSIGRPGSGHEALAGEHLYTALAGRGLVGVNVGVHQHRREWAHVELAPVQVVGAINPKLAGR